MILEQVRVANREKRPAQRREHRELIVRPLDRHQRGAERLNLFAVVKRLAAHEQVVDTARLERFDVLARDVLTETHEPAEQDADVPRLERHALARIPALGDRPAALTHKPVHVRADRVGQRRLDLATPRHISGRTARGTGNATTDGWPG